MQVYILYAAKGNDIAFKLSGNSGESRESVCRSDGGNRTGIYSRGVIVRSEQSYLGK